MPVLFEITQYITLVVVVVVVVFSLFYLLLLILIYKISQSVIEPNNIRNRRIIKNGFDKILFRYAKKVR